MLVWQWPFYQQQLELTHICSPTSWGVEGSCSVFWDLALGLVFMPPLIMAKIDLLDLDCWWVMWKLISRKIWPCIQCPDLRILNFLDSLKKPKLNSSKFFQLILSFQLGFGFFSGLGTGPLLDMAIRINPSLIPNAFLLSSIVFACFSGAALFAPDGSYLYLGGTLLSGLSTLFWLGFLNLFFQSTLIFQVHFLRFYSWNQL